MTTQWNYSDLAKSYDKRPDYSYQLVKKIIGHMRLNPNIPVADIGSGTGKLTKLLAAENLAVLAVEPNNEMTEYNVTNQSHLPNIRFIKGSAEESGLDDHSVQAVFFGSSFNVIDHEKTFDEIRRIVTPRGWICTFFNHRDLDDSIQSLIELLIRSHIPDYDYGVRRSDISQKLIHSGLFDQIQTDFQTFVVEMESVDIVEAWRSHATLRRQCADEEMFDRIVDEIEQLLPKGIVSVPYTTVCCFAKLRS